MKKEAPQKLSVRNRPIAPSEGLANGLLASWIIWLLLGIGLLAVFEG